MRRNRWGKKGVEEELAEGARRQKGRNKNKPTTFSIQGDINSDLRVVDKHVLEHSFVHPDRVGRLDAVAERVLLRIQRLEEHGVN